MFFYFIELDTESIQGSYVKPKKGQLLLFTRTTFYKACVQEIILTFSTKAVFTNLELYPRLNKLHSSSFNLIKKLSFEEQMRFSLYKLNYKEYFW